MRKGAIVEILIRAGLVGEDETRFLGAAEPGTQGVYIGRHPNRKLEDWHLVQVGDLRAPLYKTQFRVVLS